MVSNLVKSGSSVLSAGLLVAMTATMSSAQGDEAVKGVYREGKKAGVKVVVYRGQGNDRRRVANDFEFKSGDQFEMELETNQKAYIYVVNRTLSGDPGQLSGKGIERIRDDDRRNRQGSRAQYKLLYPLKDDPKTTTANKPFRMTGFKMDNQPGVEKMFVVVSAQPVDINKYFDAPGNQRDRPPARDGNRRVDTEDDVLDQLSKDLADWENNAEATLSKGVVREPEGYGVVRDEKRPGMIELTLKHFGK